MACSQKDLSMSIIVAVVQLCTLKRLASTAAGKSCTHSIGLEILYRTQTFVITS